MYRAERYAMCESYGKSKIVCFGYALYQTVFFICHAVRTGAFNFNN